MLLLGFFPLIVDYSMSSRSFALEKFPKSVQINPLYIFAITICIFINIYFLGLIDNVNSTKFLVLTLHTNFTL